MSYGAYCCLNATKTLIVFEQCHLKKPVYLFTLDIAQETTNTLVIKNLPRLESETKLKKIFKNAVGITIPKDGNNARG